MPDSIYKRVLLKFSGEVLAGDKEFGIDPNTVRDIASEIVEAISTGVQLGIVIGGGNIFRGLNATDSAIDRATGDQMGMLATIINSLAMQDALEKKGIKTRAMTAIKMDEISEPVMTVSGVISSAAAHSALRFSSPAAAAIRFAAITA